MPMGEVAYCPGHSFLGEFQEEYVMAKKIIQKHHMSYDPPVTTTLTKGEHYIVSRMSWMKDPGPGFLACLMQYLAYHMFPADVEVGRRIKK